MIDLRKPLEGVPGLLLMAALIFFGATIGIAVALTFTWIPMSDALANLLGGVVGAGLGAALAVMGAVYVQRRDLEVRLRQPTNALRSTLQALERRLIVLSHLLSTPADAAKAAGIAIGSGVDNLERSARALSDGAELAPEVHDQAVRLKLRLLSLIAQLRERSATPEDVEKVRAHLIALRNQVAVQ